MAKPKETEMLRAELAETMERWRRDWGSRDTEVYLRHSRRFSAGDSNLAMWSAQKRPVNASKAWIKVEISEVSLLLYPGTEEVAASRNLSNEMKKRQYWIREDGNWKILYEGAA